MHPGVVVVFFKQKQLFITFELIRSLSQCKVDGTTWVWNYHLIT